MIIKLKIYLNWRLFLEAIKIKEGVYWVGGIDWDLRDSHGFLTQRGSTYNAYLVIDEKITLIDTVKSHLTSEMMQRISTVIDVEKIDVIISNHVEMDHSGAIPAVLEKVPNAKVYTSVAGKKGLEAHFDTSNWDLEAVKTGVKIELGKRTVEFIQTPFVHWPDNMVTYMAEEKILFSNDSMGQHLASTERFDDEYPIDIIMAEAKKYYANIVFPYGKQVQDELAKIATLDIEIIASSHGIIWRKYVKEIIQEYVKWASNDTKKKAVIVYDTMWGSTKSMAKSIMEEFNKKNYETSLRNLQYNHISDIMSEIVDAEYLCIGSPTLNNSMLPTVAGFMAYLYGFAPKDRKIITFGSFGWAEKGVKLVNRWLEEAKMNIVYTTSLNYIPKPDQLEKIRKDLSEII